MQAAINTTPMDKVIVKETPLSSHAAPAATALIGVTVTAIAVLLSRRKQ